MDVTNECYDVVRMDKLDVAFTYGVEQTDAVARRLKTMLVPPRQEHHRGGSGSVCKAFNTQGEVFALKRLVDPGPARITAFEQEYGNHLVVSQFQGFPRVYGYGISNGEPVIIMEWIEGKPLSEVLVNIKLRTLCDTDMKTVASVGYALTRLLLRARDSGIKIVHRDISPNNIMLATGGSNLPLLKQIEHGMYTFSIVDLGSLVVLDDLRSAPTSAALSYHGTPEYAAPEMLDKRLPESDRMSPSIDVYAICSILYELYTWHTPYKLSDRTGLDPCIIKETELPDLPELSHPNDALLVVTIMDGLSPNPEKRPTLEHLEHAFMGYFLLPDDRSPRRIQEFANAGQTYQKMRAARGQIT